MTDSPTVDHDDTLELSAKQLQAHFDESTRRTRADHRLPLGQGETYNLISVILDNYSKISDEIEIPKAIRYHDWTSRFPPLSEDVEPSGLKILNVGPARSK